MSATEAQATLRSGISPEAERELDLFRRELAALERGERSADEFRRFRLENGVYGIRGCTDRYMVRVKIPLGILTPEQLERLAEIAETFTPLRLAHITTRQDIQFHNVQQSELVTVLHRLAEVGLTTREACGNTVRNVTCCPLAGVSPDEPFDVTPYALKTARFFLRNPLNQNLPRKFKIAFEGCATDHTCTAIQDLGVVARLRRDGDNEQRGFALFVGGGLGPIPMAAEPLADFVPEAQLIPAIEAVLRLFDRHGNRHDKNRARLKFVLRDWGIETFRQRWSEEFKIALLTRSGRADWEVLPVPEAPPPASATTPAPEPSTPGYDRWRTTNCIAQKQSGYFTVWIRCPLGDVTAVQLRRVAAVARRFCGGRVRTTVSQNLLLRWVPEPFLPNVYRELELVGLAEPGAERIADITRCPAADTCNLGITHARGLARALGDLFQNGLGTDPVLEGLSIKISGCPNACGQHHIANIGLYGNARTVDGHSVAFYRLLLGGYTRIGRAVFGEPIMALPAKRVPEALRTLLEHYRDHRHADESFGDFVRRVGVEDLKALLEPFSTLPPYQARPDLYGDLGAEGEFKVRTGRGECAA